MNLKFFFRMMIILSIFFPLIASASDFRTGQQLVITEDEIVNDDLYFSGNSITVDGIINGDLVAAGADIKVTGTINGGILAAGGSITVNGNVTGDVRAAGGTVIIGGDVGDNALVFAGNLNLEKSARIGRDLTIGAGNAVIDGTVNGNINGGASNVEMRGETKGNVTIDVGNNMNMLPGAKIGGNLEYTAPRPAEISGTVSGKTSYKEKIVKEKGPGIAGEIISYLWLLLIGIVSLMLAPEITQRISDNVSVKPLKNLLWGILFLIVTPIFALILLITIIGIPISLILISLYIIYVYISRVFVGFWIGQYILKQLKKETRYKVLNLAIGLVIIFIGINLPFLGMFIHLIIILLGLGAIVLTVYDIYKKLKEEKFF